jgi:hypothetical protein
MTATPTKSTIQRSWKTTINYLIAAAVAGAISVLMFKTIVSGTISFGFACIPAILCLIFLFMAMSGAGECPCPECGKLLDGLSTGSNDGKLCDACGQYFEGTGGQLWATDPSRVADTPLFTSPIPETFAFPDACCVCGKPPTHRQPISMTTQNTGGSLAAVGANALTDGMVTGSSRTRTTVEVPHCDEHKDGASLTGTKDKTHIRFRSYPYMRAFCEMNKTKPG